MALAVANYHDVYGSLPPAYIADSDGKPIHSWRVVLLQFIDETLYDQYDFAEPWDGPNNRKIAPQMPEIFSCPSDTTKRPEMTSYVVVRGPGTGWPETGTVTMNDVQDDPSKTILLVELQQSNIHWMEPRDLVMEDLLAGASDIPCLSSPHPELVNVAFVNGGHTSISTAITTPTKLRTLLTIAGGEQTPDL
jgi:hypothetical protein